MTNKKFEKNYVIRGKIRLETGLHIGGLKETVKIGGIDNPVITYVDPETGEAIPYIPGSSIKGKLRSLLELKYAEDIVSSKKDGYVQVGSSHIKYPAKGKGALIPRIFGVPASESGEFFLTRIIVRDSFPTEDTKKFWEERPELLHGTEVKAENSINRITSAANPRFFERVPPGSVFNFEMVLTVYEGDDEKEMLSLLAEGLKMLQDSYLGGMGSRGYGKIRFENLDVKVRSREYYEGEEEEQNPEEDIYELFQSL